MSEKYDCSAVTPEDKLYRSRCLQLARNAAGTTSPNPMVGAVIVCDGKIIEETLAESEFDISKVNKLILSSRIPIEKIMILTVDKNGISYIAEKDGKK